VRRGRLRVESQRPNSPAHGLHLCSTNYHSVATCRICLPAAAFTSPPARFFVLIKIACSSAHVGTGPSPRVMAGQDTLLLGTFMYFLAAVATFGLLIITRPYFRAQKRFVVLSSHKYHHSHSLRFFPCSSTRSVSSFTCTMVGTAFFSMWLMYVQTLPLSCV
jgi:hypothetical protein